MLVVYTAVFKTKSGHYYDEIRNPTTDQVVTENAEYYYCTDCLVESDAWTIMQFENRWLSPRRASRWIKTHPFVLFPDAEYVVWMGGNMQLRMDPRELVQYLGDNSVAALKHPMRDCVYKEFNACKALDDPKIMRAQKARYEAEGYPKLNGLAACNLVLRKNSPEAKDFSSAWWCEINKGSHRDQLSFNYVSWKYGIPFSTIPRVGDFVDNNIYLKHPHKSRKKTNG